MYVPQNLQAPFLAQVRYRPLSITYNSDKYKGIPITRLAGLFTELIFCVISPMVKLAVRAETQKHANKSRGYAQGCY
jgi:hypothetical protein